MAERRRRMSNWVICVVWLGSIPPAPERPRSAPQPSRPLCRLGDPIQATRITKSAGPDAASDAGARADDRPGAWAAGSDRRLQLLGDAEGDLLRGLDLDRLARLGIDAHAGLALTHLEDAERGQADAVALLEVLTDGG